MNKSILKFSFLVFISLYSISLYSYNDFCSSVTYSSSTKNASDIIFKFDSNYRCGKFANGDWWVAINENGVVNITSISPLSSNGINGYQINPNNTKLQSFDKRIKSYVPELMNPFPLAINATSSVVKVISVPGGQRKCRPCLESAAVLTITDKPIPSNTFRPGYYGKNKIFYSSDIIGKNALSKYPVSEVPSSSKTGFSDIAKRYKNVQLDHIVGWAGRDAHPIDSMPDYGAAIAKDNAVSILRFMLDDFDFSNTVHKSALINYLQMSIDLKTMAEEDVSWPANGGHGNGRKLPILFGALMLNQNSFYAASLKPVFSEDQQIYYSPVAKRALFGRECTVEQYWNVFSLNKGPKTCRDPYGFIDGGGPYIGGAYQLCCTAAPWKYTALAATLLNLKSDWHNDHFFSYVERWIKQGTWASPDPCAAYNGNINDNGKAWGGSHSCVKGSGRSINKHGINANKGHYSDPIGEEMWQYYPKSVKPPRSIY